MRFHEISPGARFALKPPEVDAPSTPMENADMDLPYNVVYVGEILDGFEFETAVRNLLGQFSIDDETARKILRSRRAVLKKGLDAEAANAYRETLTRVGLRVVVEKVPTDDKEFCQTASRRAAPADPEAAQPSGDIRQLSLSPSAPGRMPFEFRGSGSAYFRIWLVNIMLSVVTLGIYSAWAKVRRKQYVYGSTRLGGAAFEYLADPVKILKGRLIVGTFLIVYSLITNFIPRLGWLPAIAFVAVLPWMLVRSLSFNARNSALRNIRFGFRAGYWEAFKAFVLWPAAGGITLGLLGPVAYFKQRKFIVEHSSYGTTAFEFTATAGSYYRMFLSLLIPLAGGIALAIAAGAVFAPAAALVLPAAYLLMFAFFSVKTTNLFYNSCRLSSHGFEAALNIGGYTLLVLTNTLATALTLGLFHPWARVRAWRYRAEHLQLVPGGDLDNFVSHQQEQIDAFGEELTDFLDFDFGL